MNVMINGVNYTVGSGEYRMYMTLPKRLYRVSGLICGRFRFSNGESGHIEVFTNRKGKPMISLSGVYYGFSDRLIQYLSARRADLTTWINKQDGGSDIDIDL